MACLNHGAILSVQGSKRPRARPSTERARERGACLLPARNVSCPPGPFARASARCVSAPSRAEPRQSRFLAAEAANGMNSARRRLPPEFSRIPLPREESGERRAESGERRAESGERRAESGERCAPFPAGLPPKEDIFRILAAGAAIDKLSHRASPEETFTTKRGGGPARGTMLREKATAGKVASRGTQSVPGVLHGQAGGSRLPRRAGPSRLGSQVAAARETERSEAVLPSRAERR